MLNAESIRGQWNEIRGQLKEKWGQLTDDDLRVGEGNIDQLVGRIQSTTGESREAIEDFLQDLTQRGASSVAQMAESAGQYAQQAAGRIRDGYGQAVDRAREGYDQAQELVRDRPGQAVAVAFATGMLVGLCIGLVASARRSEPSYW